MVEIDRRDLRQWAIKGAEQRLLDIAKEAAAIYRAFPELRDRSGAADGDGPEAGSAAPVRQARTNRGRHMRSPAARKAARERMLKYWAARRKAKPAGRASRARKVRRAAAKRVR